MNAFHGDDRGDLAVPADAFDRDVVGRPAALQHHLCLEVVNHLADDDVPLIFQGGTALHTRLTERVRFSIDVDLKCPEPEQLRTSLEGFVDRFPNSEIRLLEPPEDLRDFGVRHRLHFTRMMFGPQPCQVLVEVVEAPVDGEGYAPLSLEADEYLWPETVQSPNLDRFTAQKMSTLGPSTIGKPVGPNERFYKANQGVCKQLFDLRVLLQQGLHPDAVRAYYLTEVDESNNLNDTAYGLDAIVPDARTLLRIFKAPQATIDGDTPRRDLWRSFEQISSYILDATWSAEELRVTAGCLDRTFAELSEGEPDLANARRPLEMDEVPADILEAIGDAQDAGEDWALDDDFEGSARLAWAWAPPGALP